MEVPRSANMSDADSCLAERRALLSQLLDAVKQCQIRFGGRAELATDSDSRVACLCNKLEAVLCHGLKKNNKGLSAIRQVTEKVTGLSLKNSFDSEIAYWHFVKEFLNRHEYERYMLLKHITSDSGRGRAWLRSALNERSLEKYMHMMLADGTFMSQYYEEWAFLMDQERSSMLPMMSAGLGSILFAINIDNSNLNSPKRTSNPIVNSPSFIEPIECLPFEPLPVITRDANNELKKKERRKKKRGTDKIVSFDDNDEERFENEEAKSRLSDKTLPASQESTSSTFNNHARVKDGTISENICDRKYDQHLNNLKDLNQDAGLSDLSGEVSLTSSTSEDSSKCSTDRAVPTNLPYATDNSDSNIPRQGSSGSISTQSSTNTAANQSSENTKTTLTPVTDTSVELILVSDDDQQTQSDSVSIPSFTDDTDVAAHALALTQKAVLSSSTGDVNGLRQQESSVCNDGTRPRSDTLSLLSETDLKQVVYTLLQKKDESEEQNRSLRHLLDQEMELSSSLRIQLEELNKQNEAKIEKEHCRIQALSRENEVLKHQLKKYVSAVQMLKRDSVQAHEVLGGANDLQIAMLPQHSPCVDHEFESQEYEKKLIQVAEMHGELMEFNERLHRTLIVKENTIKRLRDELIDLRGPLPDSGQISDEDILSDTSDDTSSLPISVRTLINIWIPSAFLTGQSNDTHHVYQVFIRIKDLEWNIYRRYSHFNILHQALKKKHKIVKTFQFPPKKAIGNRDAKLVEDRRQKLQHYLRCVMNYIVQNTTELANNPCKDTLTRLMPFFGEAPKGNEKKSGKKQQASSSSIHNDQNLYTGL